MPDNRFLCIHSHFYQPPRENPWLEAIEYQESASPYHDWNERISAECYEPNGLSRILDEKGWVVRLTNNYARTSFNFGPTLLSWLEDHDRVAYEAILEGDRISRERFNGHGNAVAQAYNHIILPLANRRDKETQVVWGVRDFEKRYGRAPEAMWLPETAVNTETLEVLVEHGMKFAILAPRQAQGMRKLGEGQWRDMRGEKIDPKRPYLVSLPGGKSIAVFFYDGATSKAVAFERLLNNGETFARRLTDTFANDRNESQLVHIATDGESYGHHHRYGDMALAYALDYIEKSRLAKITNYGQFLELFPPEFEAQIIDNSSWSCAHGIERWRADCGCNSGGSPGWHQKWRGPLRDAFDFLRDNLAAPYEEYMGSFTTDPWGMRDDYIHVVLDHSEENRKAFFQRWLKPGVDLSKDKLEEDLLKALEIQRNLILIYTSCGWFFDEVSGIETVQNLQYAARAIELGREIFGVGLERDFNALLAKAPSNLPELQNAKTAYERYALPARVDFLKIAAHLAVRALFADRGKAGRIFSYDYEWLDFHRRFSGKTQLLCGNVRITSRITHEQQQIELAAVHLGDHNLNVGVCTFTDETTYQTMVADFTKVFGRGDLAKSVRLLDQYFEGYLYSLNDLFRDQQKEVIDIVFGQTLESVEGQFVNIYDQHYPVMCYLSDIHMALPPVFSHIANYVQNNKIIAELHKVSISSEEIERYVNEAEAWGVKLDAISIESAYLNALHRTFEPCRTDPADIVSLRAFSDLLNIIPTLPFDVKLGNMQNDFSIWGHLAMQEPYALEPEWKELVSAISSVLRVRFTQ
jgi:alpha-amylase/alpha-mannosidase (GH57 family)